MRIKLMADYGLTVLWHDGGSEVGPIDVQTLPISIQLKNDLHAWAEAYDQTLNQEYPPESGFSNPEQEAAFELEGRRLWKQLQSELGNIYRVVYFSEVERRLLED